MGLEDSSLDSCACHHRFDPHVAALIQLPRTKDLQIALRRYLSSEAGWNHPILVHPHDHASETGRFRAELEKPLLSASGLCRVPTDE